jgi:imidazolonepropionase-like amidohydrolase
MRVRRSPVVEEAHRFGLPVTAHAHAHALAGVRHCVAAGVDGIEHCSCVGADGAMRTPPDLAAAIAAAGMVCPTLGFDLSIWALPAWMLIDI